MHTLFINSVLISGVEQSDSIIHIHVTMFFKFFSHLGYYGTVSRVPCAIQ